LGCGLNVVPGWVNVDGSWTARLAAWPSVVHLVRRAGAPVPAWPPGVVHHDLRRPLPFADACAEAIYASHLLEHLHFEDGRHLLRECARVLAPRGIARFVVPDLGAIVHDYTKTGDANRLNERLLMHPRARPRLVRRLYDALTGFHDHKWMYDDASLVLALTEAGFADAKVRGFRESALADIGALEDHRRVCDGEGICVEATR
jgi:predicted SAM-dependent methyltransferase